MDKQLEQDFVEHCKTRHDITLYNMNTARKSYIAGATSSSTVKELERENKEYKKEIGRIKNHFSRVCSENKKKFSDNTAILIFIQQMEESITWVNQTT